MTKLRIEDLNFNYISLAKFCVPYLPYYVSSVEMAFPGAVVKEEEVIIYQSKRTLFSIYLDGMDKPAFYIHRGGDVVFDDGTYEWSGKSASIVIKDSPARVFDVFQVGKTTLKEFRDEHLRGFGEGLQGCTWKKADPQYPEEKAAIVLKGGRETQLYDSSFTFFPPSGFTGEFHLAQKDVLENAILSEVHFHFSDWQASRRDVLYEEEGLALLKEDIENSVLADKQKVLDAAEKTSKTPIELVLENQKLLIAAARAKSFTKKSALEAYLELSELLLHNIDASLIKKKMNAAFKSTKKRKPMDLFQQILNMDDMDNQHCFLRFDWKESAIEFDQGIKQNLQHIDTKDMPIIHLESRVIGDVLEDYTNGLKQLGVELQYIDTEQDNHVFCLYKTEDKEAVIEQLAKIQIYFPD